MYFSRRHLAVGITLMACLALVLPSWRYAGNLSSGLRAHCEYTADGAVHRTGVLWTGSGDRLLLSAPSSGSECVVPAGAPAHKLYYGPDDADIFPAIYSPGAAIPDSVWKDSPAFAGSWFGFYLEVGGQLYGLLLFLAGGAMLLHVWFRRRVRQEGEFWEQSDG